LTGDGKIDNVFFYILYLEAQCNVLPESNLSSLIDLYWLLHVT